MTVRERFFFFPLSDMNLLSLSFTYIDNRSGGGFQHGLFNQVNTMGKEGLKLAS
jgi:hypothetical protein